MLHKINWRDFLLSPFSEKKLYIIRKLLLFWIFDKTPVNHLVLLCFEWLFTDGIHSCFLFLLELKIWFIFSLKFVILLKFSNALFQICLQYYIKLFKYLPIYNFISFIIFIYFYFILLFIICLAIFLNFCKSSSVILFFSKKDAFGFITLLNYFFVLCFLNFWSLAFCFLCIYTLLNCMSWSLSLFVFTFLFSVYFNVCKF